jgi:hypothetical protein
LLTGLALTVDRLTIIETWLSAHFVAIRDPRYQAETMGAASATYINSPGPNLALTPYGQQAMLLDSTGNLAWFDKHVTQGKRAKVGITYLGTRNPYRTDGWLTYGWRFYQTLGE